METPSELQELLSKGRDDYNQPIGAVAVPQPNTFSFNLRGAELEMFRMAWLATVSALTQAAGSATDAPLVLTGAGRFKLEHRAVSDLTLTGAGSTSYMLGVDFTLVNARLGMGEVVAGSALATDIETAGATGLAVTASYSYAAITGLKLLGGAQPNITARVWGDGVNRANLKPFDVVIHEAIIAPQDGLDLLADGFAEIGFQARMVKPEGAAAPFEVNWPQGV
jgi:hypothetical protein